MGPGETFTAITAMVTLFVILPAIVMRGIRDVRVGKAANRSASGSGEMRASELRTMIQTAVEDATTPLAARITDLEERLGDEPAWALRERLNGPALAAAFDADAEFDEPEFGPADRRRARS